MKIVLAVLLVAGSVVFSILYCEFIDCISDDYLLNFDTTLEQDLYRIQLCRELNFCPFPMIYDKANADPIYRKLQRWCSNYIFWSVKTFDEYIKGL